MKFNLQYELQEFREEAKELFDDDGYRYVGTLLSDRQAEQMLRLINSLEKEVLSLEKYIIIFSSKGFDE